jgi:branched-chain amino acid transport system ATP-binding protein
VLDVLGLQAWYGTAEVLRGVSLQVRPGEVLAVVGGNGAGKSTLARAVCGVHRAKRGAVLLGDRDLSSSGAVEVARAGITLVPQGRRLFGSLTVAEHLAVARLHRRPRALTTDQVIELFPRLGERSRVRARSLSGGEQQMLAIARAVLLGPDVLVLDEPTEGLAPAVVDLVAGLVRRLRADGVGVLLLEQQGAFPTEVADRVCSIDRGVILTPATNEEVRS